MFFETKSGYVSLDNKRSRSLEGWQLDDQAEACQFTRARINQEVYGYMLKRDFMSLRDISASSIAASLNNIKDNPWLKISVQNDRLEV